MPLSPSNFSDSSDIKSRFPEIWSRLEEAKNDPKKSKILSVAIEELKNIKQYDNSLKPIRIPNPIGHTINAKTVLSGVQIKWDPIRLLTGKHQNLSKIGGEHIQLTSSLGDKIDATHLSFSKFIDFIHKGGGEKCLFQPHLSLNPYGGDNVEIPCQGRAPVLALKIEKEVFPHGSLEELKTSFEEIKIFYARLGLKAVPDMKTQSIYIIEPEGLENLSKAKIINPLGEGLSVFKEVSSEIIDSNRSGVLSKFNQLNEPFEGFYFPNESPDVYSELFDLDLENTPWNYFEVGGRAYVVRKQDNIKLVLCDEFDPTGETIEKKSAAPVSEKEGATVLLSMNQRGVYEQYASEMLTFLLEGVNVMAYNNAGKGLSLGGAAKENIEQAVEVSYQYLRQIKKVPDEKILAKGQCFGGAPTSWLGKAHPKVNLMIDQSPANFHETASKGVREVLDMKIKETAKGSLKEKFLHELKESKVVDIATKALLLGTDLAENIKENRGNILLNINVPDQFGKGGDQLVPSDHPERMIDCFPMVKGKKYALSMNPGGVHVTNWFSKKESYDATIKFMRNTGLKSAFEPEVVTDEAVNLARFWDEKLNGALMEMLEVMAQVTLVQLDQSNITLLTKCIDKLESKIKANEKLEKEVNRFLLKLSFSLEHSPEEHVKKVYKELVIDPIGKSLGLLTEDTRTLRSLLDELQTS